MADEFDVLLRKARSGCAESFGQLLESARLVLLNDANADLASHLRTKEGASDLVQDTLLEAQREFASFRGQSEGEWVGWLRRTLEHNLVDAARRYQDVAKRQIDREVPLYAFDMESRRGQEVAGSDLTPSQVLSRREEGDALQEAVDRLPGDYRNVVLWRHRDRQSHEEIGHRLGRSAEAVRKLWIRALEMLADELGIEQWQP